MTDLVLVATLGEHRIAFDAGLVESVIDLGAATPVPLARPHVVGLAAARSRVLTVIDTGLALNIAPAIGNRAIVIVYEGHRYALRVDAIEDVAVPEQRLGPTEAPAGPVWSAAAIGTLDMATGYALQLDPGRVIAGPLQDAA